jgi:prevent-host-death family protein
MEQINVHQAKTHLSRLLERVEAGEHIVIARAGKPVARLVPWKSDRPPRVLGQFRGHVHIGPDFDDLPDDIQRGFEGEEP